ncbi:4-alpha-glucanotransferase [Williamsia sterculiae]|uniref:4-alpha-glucanotransferase n=1 Tax=Williamsia sterculiae TaxID=1344003 RepID=UPI000970EB33|nr:4-alpha-glucanotransferase [Williamsia sterculiae]
MPGPLLELAHRCGVATEYIGWGEKHYEVAPDTLRKVLGALGVAADTDEEIAVALVDRELDPWRRRLPPVVVGVAGTETRIPVHVPHGEPLRVTVVTENGDEADATQLNVWVDPREVDGALVGEATFALPADLPTGWHVIRAEIPGRPELDAECDLAVTPARLDTVERLSGQRWGLATQLYSIRSRRSWGVGDLQDLADIATVAGAHHGADFVQVNPLHAAQPRPPVESSPYLPTTRRFVNPLYIRVEDIPEVAHLPTADYRSLRKSAHRFDRANVKTDRIRRNRSYREKLSVLEKIFGVPLSPTRQVALDDYLTREGDGLVEFATWCALAERLEPEDAQWQDLLAHPDQLGAARVELADRISFHCWLQWICDQQLEAAQRAALDAGMDIGIMHDLAVGVQRTGADVWTLGDALATGATVGAPPDGFNQQGQDWSQPPWHPWHLAERGYRPYRDMLRTVLRHAGGLRIDHILGLFRLWWIPEGESAAAGTYVRYDHEALIGILVLEAERAGAVVVGEDLGVFEPIVQEYLTSRGVLGTSILWFEQTPDGPVPPDDYRRLCLTSVNTHDLPPTAGYLAGEHIRVRSELGLLTRSEEEERLADAEERDAVVALATQRGLVPDDPSSEDIVDALHALVAETPSALIGVALVDAVGEYRIQNQPGTDSSQYPNWQIPLADDHGAAVLVEDLADNERFARLVAALNR